jgi:hypothetical protein
MFDVHPLAQHLLKPPLVRRGEKEGRAVVRNGPYSPRYDKFSADKTFTTSGAVAE